MVICRTTSSSMAVELVLQLYYALACVIQYSRKGLLWPKCGKSSSYKSWNSWTLKTFSEIVRSTCTICLFRNSAAVKFDVPSYIMLLIVPIFFFYGVLFIALLLRAVVYQIFCSVICNSICLSTCWVFKYSLKSSDLSVGDVENSYHDRASVQSVIAEPLFGTIRCHGGTFWRNRAPAIAHNFVGWPSVILLDLSRFLVQ